MTKAGDTMRFSPPPPAVELVPGVALGGLIAGKYRVERVIGRGGMGVVVAASQLQLERTVAIKLIRAELSEDPAIVERLIREARAVASIQSEHVARVLDVGTLEGGEPFIVMEYLDGQDLETLLRSDGPLSVIDAIDFLMQACEAIAEAHRNLIVHRDLKPANLFIARQPGGVPCVKVVDFGISKVVDMAPSDSLTEPSRLVGSLYHMAPEQLSGAQIDARTDVWALGVLLFEMLTGQKPFREGAWPLFCAQVLNESAPDLAALGQNIPDDLRAAIRKCLSRQPQERFGNVAELAVALMPYGSRRSRHSLERIVRLATSTGSLSAEMLSPPSPPPSPPGVPVSLAAGGAGPVQPSPEVAPDAGSSEAPVSSDRPAKARRGRTLWALATVAGSVLLASLGIQWFGRKPASVPSESIAQLAPARAERQQDAPAVAPASPALPERAAVPPEPAVVPPAVEPEARMAPLREPVAFVERAVASEPGPRKVEVVSPPVASAQPAPESARPSEVERTAEPAVSPPSGEGSVEPAAPLIVEQRATSPRHADAGPTKPRGSAWDLSDVGYE